MVVTKTNWLGGMNQLSDITTLKEDEYWVLINARIRKNAVEAVNLPLDVTNNLSTVGNIQDITAAGSLLVAFANGQAFYKLTDGTWRIARDLTRQAGGAEEGDGPLAGCDSATRRQVARWLGEYLSWIRGRRPRLMGWQET